MILAVLQARLSSTRLPGKVLKPVLDEPMIVRQIERLRRSRRIDQLVVATSVDATDDELAANLVDVGVEIRRGPLQDVLSRFARVVDEIRPNHVVRLTGDCPLADVEVIDAVIDRHLTERADYTSNVAPRSFPRGLDAEIVSADAFRRLQGLRLDAAEREHVTLGIHRRPGEFRIANHLGQPDHSELRWTVDYPADLAFVRRVYERLYPVDPGFGMAAVLRLLDDEPELRRTEADAEAGH